MKNKLLDLLRKNFNKWTEGKNLCFHLGNNNGIKWNPLPPAELRNLICELRNEGNLIIAGPNGYMITDNEELISKYIKSRWGELTREMKPLKAMAKALNMLDQLTLWDI